MEQGRPLAGRQNSSVAAVRPGPIWPARTNLPAPLTSFVGRSREIGELTARLAETRLLTLTGIGGIGKSRLALEVAGKALNRLCAEVWLVELAAISDSSQAPSAVAAVLGAPDTGERPLAETLVTSLGDRSVLLVLDNCEHLVDAVADLLLVLLRGCPGLRVLATSRVTLGLEGEANWRVPPLTLPNRTTLPAGMALRRNPAVQLFVERARAARSDFVMTEQNADDVVRICVRLDGLPLAIELAAARVAALAPGEIAVRLDDRFSFLARSGRTTSPRQGTLRESVDWSYELLSEPERVLLRGLSIFRGGWSLEAAEAVCDGGVSGEERGASAELRRSPLFPRHSYLAAHPSQVDVLASLVEKSLVQAKEQDGGTRYGYLETIREYALERLHEANEAEALSQRHYDWCVAFAEGAAAHLRQPDQAVWWVRLDGEHDNLRAALGWTIARERAEAGLRLSIALWQFWVHRGHSGEGYGWLRRLLALESASGRTVQRAAGLFLAAKLALDGADLVAALALGEESLAIAREMGDQHTLHRTLTQLGHIARAREEWLVARSYYEEALPLRRELGEPADVAVSLSGLARVARALGEPDAAQGLLAESLQLALGQGHPSDITAAQADLGWLAHERGRDAEAAAWFTEALPLASQIKHPRRIAFVLEGFAVLAARGQPERAIRLAGAAAALRQTSGCMLPPSAQAALEHSLMSARRVLGNERAPRAWAAGAILTMDEAVELALGGGPSRGAPAAALTDRAQEVARLVARGLTNRQIADELVIHERTVANHLQRIFSKLGLTGRVQLAAWALEHGLGDDPPA